jgi:hypothetical protein
VTHLFRYFLDYYWYCVLLWVITTCFRVTCDCPRWRNSTTTCGIHGCHKSSQLCARGPCLCVYLFVHYRPVGFHLLCGYCVTSGRYWISIGLDSWRSYGARHSYTFLPCQPLTRRQKPTAEWVVDKRLVFHQQTFFGKAKSPIHSLKLLFWKQIVLQSKNYIQRAATCQWNNYTLHIRDEGFYSLDL